MRSPTLSSLRTLAILAALAALAGYAAGCKTDKLTEPKREAPPGPTTSLENPEGIQLPNIPVANQTEVDLVEQLLTHRAMYARTLRLLAQFYTEHGYVEKADWARNELTDLQRVKPYRYILDAEAPQVGVRPLESIADADTLYNEGVALMKKGGHGVPIWYNQQTMKQALAKFKELVERYPTSDKVADAAFLIAEIHKEYFEEKDNTVALEWYQRSIDLDPNLKRTPRFQMAVVYDYRLHEREKALHWYNEALKYEQHNKSNMEWCNARIAQLTKEKTRLAQAEPVPPLRPEPNVSPAPTDGSR